VLAEFDRWPTWMWANEEVATSSAGWARAPTTLRRVALSVSMDSTSICCGNLCMRYSTISKHPPDALEIARKAVHCFEPYGEDPQEPGTSRPTLTRFLSRNLYSSAVMASVAPPPNYRPDGNLDPAVVTSQPVNLANHGSLSHRHSEYVSGHGHRNGTREGRNPGSDQGRSFSANWLRSMSWPG
jgi:hypothetical protein